MSALPPAGAVMLYWEISSALLSAILRELGAVMGDVAFGGDACTPCALTAPPKRTFFALF